MVCVCSEVKAPRRSPCSKVPSSAVEQRRFAIPAGHRCAPRFVAAGFACSSRSQGDLRARAWPLREGHVFGSCLILVGSATALRTRNYTRGVWTRQQNEETSDRHWDWIAPRYATTDQGRLRTTVALCPWPITVQVHRLSGAPSLRPRSFAVQ